MSQKKEIFQYVGPIKIIQIESCGYNLYLVKEDHVNQAIVEHQRFPGTQHLSE